MIGYSSAPIVKLAKVNQPINPVLVLSQYISKSRTHEECGTDNIVKSYLSHRQMLRGSDISIDKGD